MAILHADYPEDLVALAIEAYLTFRSFPNFSHQIIPFSKAEENRLGADAILESSVKQFLPFYMQFKRPSAYAVNSRSPMIKQRKFLSLNSNPRSLFFGLRDRRANQLDYQHNVLYNLRQSLVSIGIGDATYVCPLFLNRIRYRQMMYYSVVNHFLREQDTFPYFRATVGIHINSNTPNFPNIPYFSGHVSIPPHGLVTTYKHKYSFLESGQEVCFHSPYKIENGSKPFDDFISKLKKDALESDKLVNSKNSEEILKKIISNISNESYIINPRENFVQKWLKFWKYLEKNYDIWQYAIVEVNQHK